MLFILGNIKIQAAESMPDLSSPYGMIPIGDDWSALFTPTGWFFLSALVLLALFTLYYVIQKVVSLSSGIQEEETFMNRIRDYLTEGKTESAVKLCRSQKTPAAEIIQKGISYLGRPVTEIVFMLQIRKEQAFNQLKKGIPLLAALMIGMPLFGLLGTSCLWVESSGNRVFPGETLFPLISGLSIGIFALITYFYLVIKVNRIRNSINSCIATFLDIINEPAHA
ncbi:hypothetical protein [Parabacteroides sp. Marseille-P3160]|uniref:hypothetical protein n=1 Tax=Parabacteroides sp. Marseille-P3160 TaxID=1917887 RepID=UPI0009B9E7C2|nr:hypothetical protein [Parabacteroides sp. Marseille-P3160]